ncbi:hypothetical protein [Coleofasciculus sp. FACHB-SPT9]|uniref:hypothetical protein n=1 Tax=Coleofasciculus sp. FACHB-SPT9 TaxID=2692791 RepID=UPI001682C457|nr:hypothetical protein [Coleofasciculus sp. FACHB-SPT9]MBD1889470.1 hypothetical protein [Coleofasciculus sp. FACHB-SPT9]
MPSPCLLSENPVRALHSLSQSFAHVAVLDGRDQAPGSASPDLERTIFNVVHGDTSVYGVSVRSKILW